MWTALGKPRWTWFVGWFLTGLCVVLAARWLEAFSSAFWAAGIGAGFLGAAVLYFGWQIVRAAWRGNAAALGFLVGIGSALTAMGAIDLRGAESCHALSDARTIGDTCGNGPRVMMIAGLVIAGYATFAAVRATLARKGERPPA